MVYVAVIDTNVLISALLTKRGDAPTVQILENMLDGKIVPLFHNKILEEYDEVLRRKKFCFKEETIRILLKAIKEYGIEVQPKPTGKILIDMDDLIFYEVAMEKRNENAYLITGNKKHYPPDEFIVSPAEMIHIMNDK